jgi:hypothetical protein
MVTDLLAHHLNGSRHLRATGIADGLAGGER